MKAMLAIVSSMVMVVTACASSDSAPSLVSAADPTCADTTAEAVVELVEAMGSRDAALAGDLFADGLFAEQPDLTQRIADGAHYELARFDYNGPGISIGNFGLLLRSKDGGVIRGKGAVDCQTGKLIALGLGLPE